jgi:uncharacterized membrane protein
MDRQLPTLAPDRARLASIDLLRGLVMVLMALDHVRDMLTQPLGADVASGLDFGNAPGALFFTRWVTHFCAPVFVLLAGTSAALYGARRSRADVARFLATRGLWLVLVEVTVVDFGWKFHVGAPVVLQVIWAIGVSMIALAALVWLPRAAIAAIGAALVLGHNAVDALQPAAADAGAAWLVLHVQGVMTPGGLPVLVAYPLVPWIGVMALGYALGPLFAAHDPERPRRLVLGGLLATAAFVALRAGGLYGEPNPWTAHGDSVATLVDFLDVTKYPPSLQYLLMTLGPALVLLGALEGARGRLASALVTIGRVPFFYYVVHLYVIHATALALGLVQGFSPRETAVLFFDYPRGFGVSLGGAYLFWIATILALYPACRWFGRLKARRRDWWLSYL